MKKTLLLLFFITILLVSFITAKAQSLSSSPTLNFSSQAGFADNIATDGEGGSIAISDINI